MQDDKNARLGLESLRKCPEECLSVQVRFRGCVKSLLTLIFMIIKINYDV